MNLCINIYGIFLINCLLGFCFTRDPVKILPKNPKDQERLPEGVSKNVLVIGNAKLTLNLKIDINL